MATKRSIILNGLPTRYNEEGVAAEAITPGHLVSGVTSLIKNTTTAGKVPMTIACEREEMGDDIDVDYAIGDAVKVASLQPGMVFLAWVPSGVDITAGDRLEPVTGGLFQELASGVAHARALETLGAVLVPTRCRAEVI
jgi:hypothetical protein